MHSKHIIKAAILLLLGIGTVAFVGTKNNSNSAKEPAQTEPVQKVNFAISHGHCNLGFQGELEEIKVKYPNNDPSQLKVNFSVNTNTLKVPGCNNGLTEGIQSKEMFDGSGDQYIRFKTDDVFTLGAEWYQLRGKMTIKDEEHVVRLRATPVKDGQIVLKWILEGTVDLKPFGLYSETDVDKGQLMFINLTAHMDGC